KLASVGYRRSSLDVLNPQIKSLTYLDNILVKLSSIESNADEALILNNQGFVAEGCADNIFIVKDVVMKSSLVYIGALDGMTRNAIIDIAKEQGYVVEEVPFTLHDVYTADEVFLTGTAAEVIPVVAVYNRKIGSGYPDVITKDLLHAFR